MTFVSKKAGVTMLSNIYLNKIYKNSSEEKQGALTRKAVVVFCMGWCFYFCSKQLILTNHKTIIKQLLK